MCIHNAALSIDWCYVCLRRSRSASTFSVLGVRWRGHPMVEILRDGRPSWHAPFEQEFRFGCLKAKLILASMEQIRSFSEAADPAEVFRDPFHRHFEQLSLAVQGQSVGSFTRSDGQVVREPYLRLSSQPELRGGMIGIGITKAGALVDVENDLWTWLAKECL